MQEATEDKGMEIFAQQRFYVEELDRSQFQTRQTGESSQSMGFAWQTGERFFRPISKENTAVYK